MTLKSYRPVTSSQRGLVLVDRSSLWKGAPLKKLTVGKKSNGGRNNQGRLTARNHGGGHKKSFRCIDFRLPVGEYVVLRLEYDPNRTGFIALVQDTVSDEVRYVLAPQGLTVGQRIHSHEETEIRDGNTLCLKNIPMGTFIHNVELKIGKGGQLARSAGSSIQVMGRDGVYVLVRMPSGESRKIHENCRATIGIVSNEDHKNCRLAKAGRNRWKGRRPHTRGVAMNPVDHPHGGGEGRTSGGRHPVSPTGQSAKGKKTRSKRAKANKLIVYRRQKK